MRTDGTFIARDRRSIEFFDRVRRAASTDSTVLVQGETGTGKGVVAKLLHAWSRRAPRRLVSVACGALPESLLESELFGHERGSFTGAQGRRVGKFELADGGTLFLDEIENAPLSMQVDLLRVLQERCIERVGGNDTFAVDVRLVAATNRDLARMVEAGRFREDLLFRLGVLVLDVPPLRERRDDLVPLAEHFLARLAARRGGGPRSLSAEARRELFEHDWPGNVRELEHTIERSAVFETSQELERLAFFDARTKTPAPSAHPAPGRAIEAAADGDPGTLEDARRRALEETDVRYLRAILGRFRGDVRRASAHAGLSRRGLYYLLDKYDLDAASFRDGHAPGLRVGNAPATGDGNAPAIRDGNASAQRDGNAAALRDGDAPAQRAAIPCSPAAQPRAARAESPANPAWNERGAQPTRWHVN